MRFRAPRPTARGLRLRTRGHLPTLSALPLTRLNRDPLRRLSLRLPPRGSGRQDVQPDHGSVPLQGRRDRRHLQSLRQGLPAEPIPRGPLHQ